MFAVFLTFYLAVEVRQGTLRADGHGLCRGGAAAKTGHGGWLLRADSTTTKERRRRRRREKTNIKSNNPHLMGGEQKRHHIPSYSRHIAQQLLTWLEEKMAKRSFSAACGSEVCRFTTCSTSTLSSRIW